MATLTERPSISRNPARRQAMHQAIQAETYQNRELDRSLIVANESDEWKSFYTYLRYCEIPKPSKSLGRERYRYLIEMKAAGKPVTDFFWTMLTGGDDGEFDSES